MTADSDDENIALAIIATQRVDQTCQTESMPSMPPPACDDNEIEAVQQQLHADVMASVRDKFPNAHLAAVQIPTRQEQTSLYAPQTDPPANPSGLQASGTSRFDFGFYVYRIGYGSGNGKIEINPKWPHRRFNFSDVERERKGEQGCHGQVVSPSSVGPDYCADLSAGRDVADRIDVVPVEADRDRARGLGPGRMLEGP